MGEGSARKRLSRHQLLVFFSFFYSAVFLDGPMEVFFIYLIGYYVGSSDQYYWTYWRESNK